MFENKIFHGWHVSIYIWSWLNSGGKFNDIKWDYDAGIYRGNFADWLRSLVIHGEHLTEDEIEYIIGYKHDAHAGRIELEHSAEEFLSKIGT